MATGVSSKNNASATNIATYNNSISTLKSTLNEPVPQSKNPLEQDTLNKAHALYITAITAHIETLQALTEIEKKQGILFQDGPLAIAMNLPNIKKQQRAFLQRYDQEATTIKELKDLMIELVNS